MPLVTPQEIEKFNLDIVLANCQKILAITLDYAAFENDTHTLKKIIHWIKEFGHGFTVRLHNIGDISKEKTLNILNPLVMNLTVKTIYLDDNQLYWTRPTSDEQSTREQRLANRKKRERSEDEDIDTKPPEPKKNKLDEDVNIKPATQQNNFSLETSSNTTNSPSSISPRTETNSEVAEQTQTSTPLDESELENQNKIILAANQKLMIEVRKAISRNQLLFQQLMQRFDWRDEDVKHEQFTLQLKLQSPQAFFPTNTKLQDESWRLTLTNTALQIKLSELKEQYARLSKMYQTDQMLNSFFAGPTL